MERAHHPEGDTTSLLGCAEDMRKTTGLDVGHLTGLVVVDPGVDDKRLLVIETEFARVLQVHTREGNTLSDIIRQAWDVLPLRRLQLRRRGCRTEDHRPTPRPRRHRGDGEVHAHRPSHDGRLVEARWSRLQGGGSK
ncbi:MAG: hypothetical protein HY698_21770 [Deltaproteobacteria bacterium]|nr:hypothetical protein [Deltaproteobacteria bacterium]